MTTLLKLLLWLLPIAANVWADRNGRKPNYLVMFILRGMAAIFHGAMFITESNDYWHQWWPVLIFEITSYWILFEISLNLVSKKPLLYYDHKEGDSGWIDRFFKWAGPVAHAAAKLVALLLMIDAIRIIYNA